MAEEFTLADLEKEVSTNRETEVGVKTPNTGKGATGDTGNKDSSTKYDNSHTVWVNGPKGEKFGVIQLRIPLEEFNEQYPEASDAVIGFKKMEKSFQVIMKYGDQTLLVGTYFPPKGWSTADIKNTAGKRVYSFRPSIIEIEIDEDELI